MADLAQVYLPSIYFSQFSASYLLYDSDSEFNIIPWTAIWLSYPSLLSISHLLFIIIIIIIVIFLKRELRSKLSPVFST